MGNVDRGIPFCLPQDASSREPENYIHGTRAWEFVSGMSGSATEFLRLLATAPWRSHKAEKEAVERNLYLVETQLNHLRKDSALFSLLKLIELRYI